MRLISEIWWYITFVFKLKMSNYRKLHILQIRQSCRKHDFPKRWFFFNGGGKLQKCFSILHQCSFSNAVKKCFRHISVFIWALMSWNAWSCSWGRAEGVTLSCMTSLQIPSVPLCHFVLSTLTRHTGAVSHQGPQGRSKSTYLKSLI